jgi:hypothetical protein
VLLVPQVQCLELILVVIHLANSGLLVVEEEELMILVLTQLVEEEVVPVMPQDLLLLDLMQVVVMVELVNLQQVELG